MTNTFFRSTTRCQSLLSRLRLYSFAALVVSASIVVLVVRSAYDAAQRISPGARDERLRVRSKAAEIQPLVKAFNQAVGYLGHGFEAQRRLPARAAHELKTPLPRTA